MHSSATGIYAYVCGLAR